MENIPSEGYLGPRLPREVQQKRIRHVIYQELTERQRQVLLEHYIRKKTLTQIAKEQGITKGTVSRTLKRAEKNLKRFLRY